jgi:hypothetical protein
MPLNAAGVAASVNAQYQSIRGTNNNNTSLSLMGSAWQSAIHSDSSAGVNPIASAAAPASAGIISAAYGGLTGNVTGNADTLAKMFADYWATSHLTPIAPCVTITGNDAAAKVGAYKSAITGVITTIESEPYLGALFSAVEAVTKTITWFGLDSQGAPLTGTVS